MRRRNFLKGSALLSGLFAMQPQQLLANNSSRINTLAGKKAKNIIFMVSDGMSTGTLAMANQYSRNILGRESAWTNLYLQNKVARALMDTASADSVVTDSAAASSSFGGGMRVKNGVLNMGPGGEKYTPIWQKFKRKGKKVGCVTTVTVTHATPAGFCVNSLKRSAEPEIAEMYLDLGVDLLMGGGDEFFNSEKRKDKKDLYARYASKGYQVLKNRNQLKDIRPNTPLLGIFNTGALPYTIDRNNTPALQQTPTLAEMTEAAIQQLKGHPEGFVLQVEGGKVDWAAHANDIAALLHDQIAFDEAIQKVIDFAEKDGETLVVITTDHGNANPGTIYGSGVTKKFDSIANYKYTNEYLLNGLHAGLNLQQVKDWVYDINQISLADEDARQILSFYKGLDKEEGLYNYKKLPFKLYSEIQKNHNSVGWISMQHSGDYVELAMFGPGSEMLAPFVKNTDLHNFMLQSAGVINS